MGTTEHSIEAGGVELPKRKCKCGSERFEIFGDNRRFELRCENCGWMTDAIAESQDGE